MVTKAANISSSDAGMDADGNQTLVTTATGRWRVEYVGENRPVRWTRESDGKTVAMSYDHLGRRRTKDGVRFRYDGHLQVANERTVSNEVVRQHFVWDPTEPVATRPLAWVGAGGAMRVYAHDWNKNVSEVVSADADTNAAAEVVAHYDYAAFGAVVAKSGACAEANPWRFSSECADADLGLVYYNYRHYDPLFGRWLTRDPIEEDGGNNLYCFCGNNPIANYDRYGQAHFEVRRLSWLPAILNYKCFSLVIGIVPAMILDLGLADKLNIEILHEHLFYDDGTNVGYSKDGVVTKEPSRGYTRRDYREYDDCIMKEAQSRVTPPPYSLVGIGRPKYNCQDYADSLRRMYDSIKDDPAVKCKCERMKK